MRDTVSMSSGRVCSVLPFMIHEKPSRIPTTAMSERQARMVAAPITLLMPGAGPPPTRIRELVFGHIDGAPIPRALFVGKAATYEARPPRGKRGIVRDVACPSSPGSKKCMRSGSTAMVSVSPGFTPGYAWTCATEWGW